mgnify:CR=1 FL=1
MFGFAPDPLGIDNVRSVHGRAGVVRYPNATTYNAGPGPYCGSQCF